MHIAPEITALSRLRRQASAAEGAKRNIAATGGARLVVQLVQFAVSLLLARLLSPSDYGVFAILVSVTAFATLLSDFGLAPALVRLTDLNDRHLVSAFWANLLSGVAFWALFASLAPVAEKIFGSADVGHYLPLVALLFIINTNVVQIALLERTGRFTSLGFIDVTSAVVGLVTSVCLAALDFGVISLIAGSLASSVSGTCMLWWTAHWRPTGRPDGQALRELVSIGGGLTGYNVANYWGQNLDNLLLGGQANPQAVGLYNRAFNLSRLPTSLVSGVLNRVLLPVYVEATTQQGLAAAWRRFALPTTTAMFTISAVLASGAPWLIEALYGPAWGGSAPLVTVLALSIAPTAVASTLGPLLVLRGQGGRLVMIGVAKAALLAGGIGLGLSAGTLGVSVGVTLANYMGELLIIVPALGVLGLRGADLRRFCLRPSALAIACALPGIGMRLWGYPGPPLSGLCLQGLSVLTIFIIGGRLLLPELFRTQLRMTTQLVDGAPK